MRRGEDVLDRVVVLEPFEELRAAGERSHGAAVDALQRAGRLELLQVAADRVGRDLQLVGQGRGHDAAVAVEAGEDRRLAFGGEVHVTLTLAQTCTNRQKAARTCRKTAVSAIPRAPSPAGAAGAGTR